MPVSRVLSLGMVTPSTGDSEPATVSFEERIWALEAQDKLDEALETCEDALARDWNDAIAHNLKGLILDRMGRMKEAIEAYREATFADPDFVEARENLREAQADGRSHLLGKATPFARAAAICAALCVPVFMASSVMRFAVQPVWKDGLLSGDNSLAASVIRLFLGGVPYGIAFVVVGQFTRPGAASVAHFLAGLFSSSASSVATGWIVNGIWVLLGSDSLDTGFAIQHLVYPVLATILIGGALLAMFGIRQKGWMVPLAAGLSFVIVEAINWGAIAGALFPIATTEYATIDQTAYVIETIALLSSISKAVLFGAGVGAALQWHKLDAADSEEEDDDDGGDGMAFPTPSIADKGG